MLACTCQQPGCSILNCLQTRQSCLVNSYIYSVTIIESRKNEGMDEFLKIQDSQGLYVYLSRNEKKLILLLKKRERNSAGEWLLCANSDKLYICTVCACQKKKIQIWNLWHVNAHINTITLFSVHVNTTFRFINRNEFSPIEPQVVHTNVASSHSLRNYMILEWVNNDLISFIFKLFLGALIFLSLFWMLLLLLLLFFHCFCALCLSPSLFLSMSVLWTSSVI